MYVKLNVDGQFGPDGPQKYDTGEVTNIRMIDDEPWALVMYYEYQEMTGQWTKLEHLLWPSTNKSTYGVLDTISGAVLNRK